MRQFQLNKHRPNLSEIERNNVGAWLLQNSKNSKLRYGAKKEAASLFGIEARTVWRIWKAAQLQQALGKPQHLVSMKKGSVHSNRKYLDEEKLKSVPVLDRGNLRKVATHLGVSLGLAHRWLKQGKILAHTNAIKSFLTPNNMITRLKWSLSMLTCISSNGRIAFQTMYHIIHVDEKWFNVTNEVQRYYVVNGEVKQHRTCKSKQHIDKIMFLCAVGRPLIDADGNEIFDGKFGIFPFSFKEPATRNSKNRPKGTIITKPIVAITKQVMKDAFLQWLVPTIIRKWPEGISKNIIIQQDNAKPHINNSDPDFQAIAHSNGFNIQLVCQPPNSPDTNVNDLGFFRAIQTLKDEKLATNVEGLIKNVQEAFDAFPSYKINDVFLTLQGCYKEIIKHKGNNDYSIPHMGKEQLKREGTLPETLDIDEEDVNEAYEYLQLHDCPDQPIYNLDNVIQAMQQVELQE